MVNLVLSMTLVFRGIGSSNSSGIAMLKRFFTSFAIVLVFMTAPAKAAMLSYSNVSTSISVIPLGLGGFGTTTFETRPFPGATLWRLEQDFPKIEGGFGFGRETEGRAKTSSIGFLAEDGFFLDYALEVGAACVADGAPVSGTCTPTLGARANAVFTFRTDVDALLYLDGIWNGGDPQTNLADAFSFLLREFPTNARLIDENDGPVGVVSGTFTRPISLRAGRTYRVDFQGSANAASNSSTFGGDSMRLRLAASVLDANADTEAFARRAADALTPVPLPATLPLLLGALAAVRVFARSRRRT